MAIVTTTRDYQDDAVQLEAFIAYDDAVAGRRPAVLINHAWR